MKPFNKQLILIVFAGLIAQVAISQSHKFLVGGWKTTANEPITRISASNLDEAKIFKISTTSLDSSDVRFSIYVDGQPSSSNLHEGGSAYVEGKSISIKQTNNGAIHAGMWEVVNEEQRYLDQLTWVCPAGTGKTLVASFSTDTRFVFSSNAESAGCSDGKIALFIDGIQIKEAVNNSNLLLLEGSSYHGKGKKVEISITGNCSGVNSAFSGSLKFIR